MTHLKELYLNNNKLSAIHKDAFIDLEDLKIAHMQNNYLNFVYNIEIPFMHTKSLTELNLRNNSITSFEGYNLFNLDLEHLDLSYNRISKIELNQMIVTWRDSISVNLTHNNIKTIECDQLSYAILNRTIRDAFNAVVNMEKPNVLWKWQLKDNNINCDCNLFHFVKFLKDNYKNARYWQFDLENLTCASPANFKGQLVSNIKYEELVCPLDDPKSDIKYCPSKCSCWARPYYGMGIINCSNAGLKTVPSLANLRDHAIKAYELNIEYNNISELPIHTESGYGKVVKIHARNNSIREIYEENLPKNLTILDIRNNKLRKINDDVMSHLNKTGKLETMKLMGNPLECLCDFVPLIRNTDQSKIDYLNITCVGGKLLKDIDCSTDPTLVIMICVVVSLLCLFIGTVVALYYKYQTEVKVWMYARGFCPCCFGLEDLDKDKKYDAFISFSHLDSDFVENHLQSQLENGPHPFKLCLHFRDWLPGELIPTQVRVNIHVST